MAGSNKKSAELLARYCDALLRKGFVFSWILYVCEYFFSCRSNVVDEIDIEAKLNGIMVCHYILCRLKINLFLL